VSSGKARVKDQEGSDLKIPPFLRDLLDAPVGDHIHLLRAFVLHWTKALGASEVRRDVKQGLFHFVVDPGKTYLRGFEHLSFWLLTPETPVSEFLRLHHQTSERKGEVGNYRADKPILLCLSAEQEKEAHHRIRGGRVVILGLGEILNILNQSGGRGRGYLLKTIRSQVSPLSLHPYDISRPVSGDVFVGRRTALDILIHQEQANLLIVGPSKIGKSSLLHQLKHLRQCAGDPILARSFYINLQPCAYNASPEEVARYIAMHFRETHYTLHDLTERDIRSFFSSVVARLGGPFELILDECDAICKEGQGDLLERIAEFASSYHCRLILIGRGNLLRYCQRRNATALGRLRELRFRPLRPDDAWELFSAPLLGLGLTIEEPEKLRAHVLRITSRMPHLIHEAAREIVEAVHITDSKVVSSSLFRRGHNPFSNFGLLKSHLNDLANARSRFVACTLLLNPDCKQYDASRVGGILRKEGLKPNTMQITELCDDLVINCLLGWESRGYSAPRWDIQETAKENPELLREFREEARTQLHLNS